MHDQFILRYVVTSAWRRTEHVFADARTAHPAAGASAPRAPGAAYGPRGARAADVCAPGAHAGPPDGAGPVAPGRGDGTGTDVVPAVGRGAQYVAGDAADAADEQADVAAEPATDGDGPAARGGPQTRAPRYDGRARNVAA